MKYFTILSIMVASVLTTNAVGQRLRVFSQFGTSDVGYNKWYQTDGDLTVGMLIPLGKSVSFGPVYTYMPNVKYYVYDYKNGAEKTTGARFGAVLRYNVVKLPKFEVYLQNMASYLKVSYSGLTVPNSANQFPPAASASTMMASAGTGFVYKVTPGFQINIFEFNVSYSNLSITDRKVHKDFRTGLIFQLFRSK